MSQPAAGPPKRVIFDPPGGPPRGAQKWPFLVRMPGIVHLLLPIISKNLSLIRGGPPGGPPGPAVGWETHTGTLNIPLLWPYSPVKGHYKEHIYYSYQAPQRGSLL